MKNARRVIARQISVMVLTILAALFAVDATLARAGTYLGEFCLSTLATEDEHGPVTRPPWLFRLGVTSMGDNYFLVQGSGTSPGNATTVANGAAVVLGNEVLLTGNNSRDGTSVDQRRNVEIFQARLNSATLSGTFWSIGQDFVTSTRTFVFYYYTGTATRTTCP